MRSKKKIFFSISARRKRMWLARVMDDVDNNAVYFAAFALAAFTMPYFMWSTSYKFSIIFRIIAGLLCILLLLRSYYPKNILKYYPALWIVSLVYCLPFMTTCVLLSDNNSLWNVHMALSIFLLSALVDWMSFLLISFIGILLGYAYVIYSENFLFIWSEDKIYSMIYTVLFATVIGFIFNRSREMKTITKISNIETFASAVAHEVKSPMSSASMNIITVQDLINSNQRKEFDLISLDEAKSKLVKQFLYNAYTSLNLGLHNVDLLLTATANFEQEGKPLDWREHYASRTIISALEEINHIYNSEFRNRISFQLLEDFVYIGSRNLIKSVTLNLIHNAIKYALRVDAEAKLKVIIEHGQISFVDTGPGVREEVARSLFQKGVSTSGTGIGLAFAQHVASNHGGRLDYIPNEEGGSIFTITLPVYDENHLIDNS